MKKLLIIGLMVLAGTILHAAAPSSAAQNKTAAEAVTSKTAEGSTNGQHWLLKFKKWSHSRGDLVWVSQWKRYHKASDRWINNGLPYEGCSVDYSITAQPDIASMVSQTINKQKVDAKSPDTPRPSSKNQKSEECPL